MRFHQHHGWTLDLLKSYLLTGSFIKMDGWPDVGISDYYVLEVGSQIDVGRLYDDGHVGELSGAEYYGELKGKSAVEILKERNW